MQTEYVQLLKRKAIFQGRILLVDIKNKTGGKDTKTNENKRDESDDTSDLKKVSDQPAKQIFDNKKILHDLLTAFDNKFAMIVVRKIYFGDISQTINDIVEYCKLIKTKYQVSSLTKELYKNEKTRKKHKSKISKENNNSAVISELDPIIQYIIQNIW